MIRIYSVDRGAIFFAAILNAHDNDSHLRFATICIANLRQKLYHDFWPHVKGLYEKTTKIKINIFLVCKVGVRLYKYHKVCARQKFAPKTIAAEYATIYFEACI